MGGRLVWCLLYRKDKAKLQMFVSVKHPSLFVIHATKKFYNAGRSARCRHVSGFGAAKQPNVRRVLGHLLLCQSGIPQGCKQELVTSKL